MGYLDDAKGLSKYQFDLNKQIAELNAELNRYNIDSPYGSVNWSKDPETGKYSQSTSLSPWQQGLYQQNVTYDQTSSGLAQKLLEAAYGKLAKPMDYNGLPQAPGINDFSADRQRYEDAAYNRLTKGMDDQYSKSRENLSEKLLNEGIPRGSLKYQEAMRDFDRSRNEDYAGAKDRSVALGSDEQSRMYGLSANARDRAVRERSDASNDPLRKISALLSGSSAFQGGLNPVASQVSIDTPNFLGAAQGLAGIESNQQINAANLAQDQNQFETSLAFSQDQFDASKPNPWGSVFSTAASAGLGALGENLADSFFKSGKTKSLAAKNWNF